MSNYKPKLIYKSEKPYEGDINDLIEKSSKKDEMKVSRKEMINEHKKLVDVLESPSHKDDKKEAKKQAKELKEYENEEIKKGSKNKP